MFLSVVAPKVLCSALEDGQPLHSHYFVSHIQRALCVLFSRSHEEGQTLMDIASTLVQLLQLVLQGCLRQLARSWVIGRVWPANSMSDRQWPLWQQLPPIFAGTHAVTNTPCMCISSLALAAVDHACRPSACVLHVW